MLVRGRRWRRAGGGWWRLLPAARHSVQRSAAALTSLTALKVIKSIAKPPAEPWAPGERAGCASRSPDEPAILLLFSWLQ